MVPVINLLSLSSNSSFTTCSVKMDLRSLNIFPLPVGMILSCGSRECRRDNIERTFCSWFKCLPSTNSYCLYFSSNHLLQHTLLPECLIPATWVVSTALHSHHPQCGFLPALLMYILSVSIHINTYILVLLSIQSK